MSQTEFNEAAQDSIMFAVFKAETDGISVAQVTLWLNALRGPRVVDSQAAISKHFGA